MSRFIFNQEVEVALRQKFSPHGRAKQGQADDVMAAQNRSSAGLSGTVARAPHSTFSSSRLMVPMANCMRTCTRTGSLRRSSVSQM